MTKFGRIVMPDRSIRLCGRRVMRMSASGQPSGRTPADLGWLALAVLVLAAALAPVWAVAAVRG